MPKVSIIVPTYNVENYLRECMDSIVGQTLKDIEIICINDGSTDGSLEILKNYAAKDPRIIIVDKKKQLETLEQYKKSLIYEYVTGKKEILND